MGPFVISLWWTVVLPNYDWSYVYQFSDSVFCEQGYFYYSVRRCNADTFSCLQSYINRSVAHRTGVEAENGSQLRLYLLCRVAQPSKVQIRVCISFTSLCQSVILLKTQLTIEITLLSKNWNTDPGYQPQCQLGRAIL